MARDIIWVPWMTTSATCTRDAGAGGAAGVRKGARRQAIVQLAALAGALTLARSVAEADPALSDEILEATIAALGPATN